MTNIKLFGVKYTYCVHCALHVFIENLAFNKKIHIDFRIDFFCIPLFPAYFIPCNIIFPSYKFCWTPSKLGICSIFFFKDTHAVILVYFFWYKSTLGYIQQPHTVQCVCVHGYARNSNVLSQCALAGA